MKGKSDIFTWRDHARRWDLRNRIIPPEPEPKAPNTFDEWLRHYRAIAGLS